MNNKNLDSVTKNQLKALEPLLSYVPNSEKFAQFHRSTSKVRLLLGGRRSGKTSALVVETCWAALGIHPYNLYPDPPLKIRYCCTDFINGIKGIVLPMFERYLGKFDNGPFVRKYWAEDRVLELKNGTIIQMASYEQPPLKMEGVERHLCAFDEEPPLDFYQSNYMRTISGNINGKIIMACTPINSFSWIYDLLYDNPEAVPPAVEHWHVRIDENPHISKEAIEAVKRDPAMRDSLHAVLYGEFVPKSNLVFPRFSDRNICPITRPTSDDLIILGIDPHDRNPWGVVFLKLDRDNVYTVYDEILEQGTTDEIADIILEKLGARKPNFAAIDTSANIVQSTSGKSIKDILLRRGIYCVDADKDVQSGVMMMNTLFDPPDEDRPRLYIAENCVNTIRQIKRCQWEDWARKKVDRDLKERIRRKDSHLPDALRYAIMLPIVYRHPEFRPTPKPPVRISSVTGYF